MEKEISIIPRTIMNKILTALLSLLALAGRAQDRIRQPDDLMQQDGILQLVLTSDVHYGITRAHFRNADSVQATMVNKAMIAAIDKLPRQILPGDSGIDAGKRISYIDALVVTGDMANREEKGIQCAASSWQQFEADYTVGLTTKGSNRQRTALWLTAGNHDVSNALGYCRHTEPARDASAMAGIYNTMLHPALERTKADYNYATDKIHYSKDIGGLHLLFVNLWPDSTERRWIEEDLKTVKPGTPVLLFTHSMPDVEGRFFINPNGEHTINDSDKFENLLTEQFKDGFRADQPAAIEQRSLAAFLKQHPAIVAWFHGHSNYNEFYDWHGPDNDLTLHCFRVDSPMKGRLSSKDETRLSFQLITIDTRTKTMTVRECLWNTSPDDPSLLKWGQHRTVSLD